MSGRAEMMMNAAHENATRAGKVPRREDFDWAVEKFCLTEEEFEAWASKKSWTAASGDVEGP